MSSDPLICNASLVISYIVCALHNYLGNILYLAMSIISKIICSFPMVIIMANLLMSGGLLRTKVVALTLNFHASIIKS